MALRGLGAWALAGLTAASTLAACPAAAEGEAGASASAAPAAVQDDNPPTLTAEQIVEKNVTARGGLDAWRKIRTMIWTGHIATGDASASGSPFVLEYKRPNKTRFEFEADHVKTLRVFDGDRGWKIHTSSSGAPSLRRYSPLELRSAHDAQGLDGLLIDHQAKGIKVALEGTDDVEGHKAYRLSATLPSGAMRHVWIDAYTYLDLKYDRETRGASGRVGTLAVFYRNFLAVDGLQIPMTIETQVGGEPVSERMTIDNVTLNPSLSDAHFERPNAPQGRHAPPGVQSRSNEIPRGASHINGSPIESRQRLRAGERVGVVLDVGG